MEMIVDGSFFLRGFWLGAEVWAVGLKRERGRRVSKGARVGNAEVKMTNQRRSGGE